MAAEKVAASRIRWTLELNRDTAKAKVPLIVPSRPSFSASLNLGANVHKTPPKYEFSILLGGDRVAGLDINPSGSHYNFVDGTRESVRITHWHTWPETNVETDKRTLTFTRWLRAFCERYKVQLNGFDAPPHYGGEQGRLF
jgi:hypothetical protein